jgi:hypothetical protein
VHFVGLIYSEVKMHGEGHIKSSAYVRPSVSETKLHTHKKQQAKLGERYTKQIINFYMIICISYLYIFG